MSTLSRRGFLAACGAAVLGVGMSRAEAMAGPWKRNGGPKKPRPTPTPSPTVSPTPTPSPTPTFSPTPTPTPTVGGGYPALYGQT